MSDKYARGTPGLFAAAATAGGIIAQQVAGKAVRDALFLSSFKVSSLPFVMAAGAVASLAAVFWTSQLMSRHAPRRMLFALFGASGLALCLEWLALPYAPLAGAVAVYLHVAVFSPVILSVFWSVVNEQFDPHTARSAVVRIATGGTLGGVIGGLGAWRASTLVSVPWAVLLLAGVNLLCLVGTLAIPHRHPVVEGGAPSSVDPAQQRSWALSGLFSAPYLRNLALLVALGSAVSTLLDYVLSARATATYGSGAPLLAFFSLFGLGVSLFSFFLQVSLGRVAMDKVGPALSIAVLPGIVVLGGAASVLVPGIVSGTILRGAEMVQRNTVFRSAYEMLYTPLQEQQKRVAKGVIDIGFDRLGTVLGSGIAIGAVALVAEPGILLLAAAMLLAVATFPVVRNLHGGYVAALKGRLREVEGTLPPASDANSRPTGSFEEKAGDALIEEVARVHQHDDGPGRLAQALAHGKELLHAAEDLLSPSPARARGALSGWDESKLPLVSFGILLLANEELQADARKALRQVANDATGQLLDALLDHNNDFVVRRRIPAILAVCKSQRAADGLLLGLRDERFEVRYACGRALVRVAEGSDEIAFVREQIIAAISHEIEHATTVFSDLDDGSEDDDNPGLELIARDRMTRSVENVFSLLSLILERDGLRLCLRGLQHEDDHHRGTALEYLQTVLPAELRDQLLPLLSEAGPIPTARAPAELLEELTTGPLSRAFTSDGARPARVADTPAAPDAPPPALEKTKP